MPGNLGSSPSRYITAVKDIGTLEKKSENYKDENAVPTLSQSQSMMRYNSIFSSTPLTFNSF